MEQAAPGPPADQAEVLFLLVQALHATPGFAGLANAVAESAAAQRLLPRRHDVHGAEHALSFAELQQRYAHLPPNALQQLLSQLLERRRAETPQPAARGLTSLLEPAALSVLSGGGGGGGTAPALAASGPPSWLRSGRLLPSDAYRLLLLRQAGLLRSAQHPAAIQPPEAYARQLAHSLTVRGHRFAVYCLAYDRTGRYLITGSDDRLVKIWSTTTGLLQAACRGHDAEVTDLSVSADNSLVASSSMDGTVRVWQLEGSGGRPGLPVSVLVGHGGPAAFVDFHPTRPDALLSASFDGTCRIWRARDASAPPIVLTVDPRFGLSGHAVTRLGGLGWPGLAGSRATAAGAENGGLDVGPGVRTTRSMERQLLGLLGDGSAGAAGTAGNGPSGSQPQQGGTRHSGRTRQQQDLSEAAIEEARRRRWDAVFGQNGAAEEDEEQAEDEGGNAGGEGGSGGGTTGLLVCGFSRDGAHIVAGGNDCSVYVWQWEAPPAAGAEQQQQLHQLPASPPGKDGRRFAGASPGALAGQASAAAAVRATSPLPGQQQQEGAACGQAAEPAAEAAAGEAPGFSAAAGPSGCAQPADPPAAEERQQHAQPLPVAQQQGEQGGQQAQRQRGGGAPAAALAAAAEDAPWPAPKEVCQLKGHRNDVILLQFSHAGDRVATGSKDGSVRVWHRPRRWRKRAHAWEQEVTFAVLPDPEAIKEARRRRRPPPAPSVDQIAWSADDQLLCVSITDFGIRVLAMPGGQVLHNLSIHTSHVHVLECHPTDPALAFSASYDGTIAVWDMRSGEVLRRFSSRQTRPDGRSWPDLIPLSDGHFSPDGRSITVTDVAGQLHHYVLGPRCALLARAPYDQFLTTDYNALMRDLQHNVVDAETQLAPHLVPGLLCDTLGNPYPEPLQTAYREQRVLLSPAEEVAWLEPGKEPGYLLAAPTLTAAVWAVEQVNGTEHAVQLAIARAQERLTVHEDRLDAGASAAAAHEAAAAAGQPAPRRRQRGAAAWAAAELEVVAMDEAAEPESSGDMYTDSRDGGDSDEDVDSALLTSEEEDEDYEEEEEGGGRGRRSRQAALEASRHSSRLAGRRTAGRTGTSRPSTRHSGGAAAAAAEPEGRQEQREERQRADREARAARRRAAQQERLAEERHRRQRAAAARRQRAADSSDEEAEISELSEDEAGPSRRAAAAQPRASRRRGRAEMEAEEEAGPSEPAAGAAGEGGRQRKRQRHGGWRELVNYGWLLVSEQTPGVYVPQVGDSVVYLREGHERFLTSTNDKRPPPWHTLRGGRGMRPAEPCTVVSVEYVIANDGTDHTLAQLTLSVSEEASPLKDTCFAVEVPPPIAGHAEFVVHHSRFEASLLSKCWEVGHECQTYWNEDETTGTGAWWLGRIVADQRGGRHADVLADPFAAGDLWDRFEVEWQGKVGPDGQLVDEQAPNSNHCPWELYMPGTTHQAAMQEAPTLDAALTQRMLAAVEAAAKEDRFVLFVAAPEYDEVYVSLNRRSQPYNRLVALPLSLTQLSDRLRSGYYRQPAALACDIATIASNAATFNGADSELADDAAALAQYLTLVLQGQEPDLATYATYPEDLAAAAAEAEAAGASRGRSRRQRRSTRRRQHGEEDQEEEQMQGAAVLPELPPLDPLAGLPPIPVSELPPLPLPQPPQQGAQAEQAQHEQQEEQGQQAQQEQLGLSGLPASTSPNGTAPLGLGSTAGSRAGGGLTVRFTVPQHLRSAAAATPADAPAGTAAATAAEDVQGGKLQTAAARNSDAQTEVQPVAAAPPVAADGRPTEPAAAVQVPPPVAAAEPAAAMEHAGGAAPAPAAPLQDLFADVAAMLCQPGDGPPAAGAPSAATAVPAAPAATAAAAAPPPASWFAAQPGGWPAGGADYPAAAAGAAAALPSIQRGQGYAEEDAAEEDAAVGRRALRASGGSRRQTYAEYAEEAEDAGSSHEAGGRGHGGRQRRGGTTSAAQQQGRRTTGRARQQQSYREVESEDEDEDDAWGEAPARQQRASRPRQQRRQQQESDEDYMEEDGLEDDEEEGEDAGSSGGSSDDGRAARRRSGRQVARRRR
ncbi:hypothetical protein ABPG75_005665 [Micractinium tetrahymenae]